MLESLSASLVLFITLVSQAFGKIMLMLLGVIIAFLAIPQSRAAAMFGIAVASAFAGGILIQLYATEHNWGLAAGMASAFGAGFVVYPFLTFFRKFNVLVSQDDEIVELLFAAMKKFIKKFIKTNK